MRIKTENNQAPNQGLIGKLKSDATEIDNLAREGIREAVYKKTRKLILEKVLTGPNQYDEAVLKKLYRDLHKKSESTTEKKLLVDTFSSNISTQEKINFIARLHANNKRIPTGSFLTNVNKLIRIIKDDNNLQLFLDNPQQFIYTQPNLSAYQQQVLKQLISNPQFNNLPSINRKVATESEIETPITYYTKQVEFQSFGSSDATRFPQCINDEVKKDVLAKSKKEYYGPPVVGMGALPSYNRNAIEQTAKGMKKMKKGACHNFAQLAADHLFKLMDEGKIAQQHVKMVSHNNGLGSHTFLLLGHDSDDLSNLSNCLIIDGWAVAMGHKPTSGVFTKDVYPFPSMTTDLVLCYDNQAPTQSQSNSENGSPSLNEELGQRLSQGGFFSRTSAVQKEEALSSKQQAVVNFLNGLDSLTANSTKKSLFKDLIDSVKEEAITPEQGAKMAALAFHARSIEIDKGSYTWRGLSSANEAALDLFNNPAIVRLWSAYSKKQGLIEKPIASIDLTLLDKVVKSLKQTEVSTYTKGEEKTQNLII